MEKIYHQLKDYDYYVPNWEINYLLLGTFNPSGAKPAKYYYGRCANNNSSLLNETWSLISNIFNDTFHPNNVGFFDLLKKHKIGCMDMIHSVEVPNNKLDDVQGKGYKDSKIINKVVKRTYSTERINQVISKNPKIKVYSTWGKGSSLKEWKNEINLIQEIIPLVSPSRAARVPDGKKKFEYMLNDWKEKLV